MISVWTVLALAVLGISGIAGTSSAHLPIYSSGGSTMSTALKIPDANTSYGITAEFPSSADRIQFYAFSAYAGQHLWFELDVPAMSGLKDFAPVVVLIGPGLGSPDSIASTVIKEFDITLSSGEGAVSYLYNGTENVISFEPFTQTNLWVRQSAETTLPYKGTYYLAVAVPQGWPHDATSGFGKYILAPGTVERFGLFDYMSIPIDWVRWHAFWEQSIVLLMIPTFLVIAIGIACTWYYLNKRGSGILQSQSRTMGVALYLGVTGALMMMGSAVNQMALLFGYTMFSLDAAGYVELMLQVLGLILGILAIRVVFTLTKPRSSRRNLLSVVMLVVIGFAALTVGAGWLAGPVLFVCAALVEMVSARRPGQTEENPVV